MVSEEEDKREDIYDKKGVENMVEDDEVKPEEAGFMEGYEDVNLLKCDNCLRDIDPDKEVEREVNGEMHTFCSEECADSFAKKNE
jgi:hypothetical protein